jgi:alpha-L-rhamnosidase
MIDFIRLIKILFIVTVSQAQGISAHHTEQAHLTPEGLVEHGTRLYDTYEKCMNTSVEKSEFSTSTLIEQLTDAVRFIEKPNGDYFIDFGKAAFGTLAFFISDEVFNDSVEIQLGESIIDSTSVNIKPAGTIRGWSGQVKLRRFKDFYVLVLPDFEPPKWAKPDEHVPVPHEIKNIMPFRYCEIRNLKAKLQFRDVKQLAIRYPFNDHASAFISSSDTLNQIWDLCKYSIKATTFCGVYVDGDRERKPYEADAYINQLSHYCVDAEYALARYTQEYFFNNPTWPTEWKSHSVLMAWEDYLYTGDSGFLAKWYNRLKNEKALLQPLNKQGLLMCTYRDGRQKNDIIDWPAGERDGYELREVNLVPNAFYYRSVVLMSKIAEVLGKTSDHKQLREIAGKLKSIINSTFFDHEKGLYIDAIGSTHSSLHASLFPLAFGLVDEEHKPKILDFIKSRGMACSVYGAQYLLDALYQEGESQYALDLLTSASDRSWWNMIRVGSTITLEAWDIKYKPNLDWNHAWGAAPANIIPRQMFGIQPIEPGFSRFRIKPQTANLKHGALTTPTIKGPVTVSFVNNIQSKKYSLSVEIPANTTAEVYVPEKYKGKLSINGKLKQIKPTDGYYMILLSSGKYLLVNE